MFFELAKHSTEMMHLHPSQVLSLPGGDFISNKGVQALVASMNAAVDM